MLRILTRLLLVLVGACSTNAPLPDGEVGIDGGPFSTSPSYAALCLKLKKQICAQRVRCGEFEMEAGCLLSLDNSPADSFACRTPAEPWVLDVAETEKCISARAAHPTCNPDAVSGACGLVFQTKNVPAGGACKLSSDCQKDHSCSSTCGGLCQALTLEGQPYGSYRLCTSGTYPRKDGLCAPVVAVGSNCADAMAVDDNQSDACGDHFGKECREGVCAVRRLAAVGEACKYTGDDSPCQIGSSCDGVCVAFLGLGQECGAEPGGASCKGDLTCLEGVCSLRILEGERCSGAGWRDCQPGHHCNAEGRCEVNRRVGEPCVGKFDCGVALSCDKGLCTNPFEHHRCNAP